MDRRRFLSNGGRLAIVATQGISLTSGALAEASGTRCNSLNVATIGHISHGKTTLASAILAIQSAKSLAQPLTYRQLGKRSGGTRRPGNGYVSRQTVAIEYGSRIRHYIHFDLPGHVDFVDTVARSGWGVDVGILVVSGTDGPMPQTKEHLIVAQNMGIRRLIVFVSKCDLVRDPDRLDLVELETRELANRCGFPGDDIPLIRGSALKALEAPSDQVLIRPINDLISALDKIETPTRKPELPLLLPVDRVYERKTGSIVTGVVEQGAIEKGHPIELVGLRATREARVVSLRVLEKAVQRVTAGDHVGCFLDGIDAFESLPGRILCAPDSVKVARQFQATIDMLSKKEGGRHTPFVDGYSPQFFLRTAEITGRIWLAKRKRVMPGDKGIKLDVTLTKPTILDKGQSFVVREGGRTVGYGEITS